MALRPENEGINRQMEDLADLEYAQFSGKSRASYLELLCQAPSVADLEPRVRLNLQQSLLQFVKDEAKWLMLPSVEQRRLLKRLTNRMGQTMYFAETVTLPCPNDRGELVPTQVNLLLDATRNDHLSRIFDQIVNPEIALTFHQEFCFGLLELIDTLVALEERVLTHRDRDLAESFLFFKIFPEGDMRLLPFSIEDLETIQRSRVGIQVELIPRFLRLPLHRLYRAISSRTRDFPSLTLQFYLERFFSTATWRKHPDPSPRREDYIRTLLTKSFYAIVRSRGLTLEQLEIPQVPRLSWSDYLTLDDDNSTLLDLEQAKADQQSRFALLQERLELISRMENSVVAQRRMPTGPLTLVELTYDQVLNDAVHLCLEQESHAEIETRTWLPSLPVVTLPPDREALFVYLEGVTREAYLKRLPRGERQLIEHWSILVSEVVAEPNLVKQLEALEETPEHLQNDLLLLLADRHRWMISQNTQTILSIISSHVSRMMHLGTVTPHVVIERRYPLLQEKLLPFVYYVADPEEENWLASPYPYGTLLLAIEQAYQRQDADGPLSAQLLEELAQIEWRNLN